MASPGHDGTPGEKQNTTELDGPDLLHQRLSQQVCGRMWIDPIVLSSHGGDRVTEICTQARCGNPPCLGDGRRNDSKGAMLSGAALGRESRKGWHTCSCSLRMR